MNRLYKMIILSFLPLSLLAQNAQTLTLEKAIQLGVDNSKQLQVSKAKLAVANAKYDQTMAIVLPSLNVSAAYTRQTEIPPFAFDFPGVGSFSLPTSFPNNYSTQASASEVIFSGFRLKYAISSAKFVNQAASLDAENDKKDVVFNIVNAYYNLTKLYQTQYIIQKNLDQVRQHVAETQNGEQSGIATHNDVLRWQLQESNIELSKLDIDNNISAANFNLDLLLGLPTSTVSATDTSNISSSVTLKGLDEYQQLGVTSRSDIQSLTLRNKADENNLKIAKNSLWPIIKVGGNIFYSDPNPLYFPAQNVFKATWNVGISLNFDVMNLFTNKHNVDERAAILNQGNASLAQMNDIVSTEVYQNYLNYSESTDRLKVLRLAVQQASENYTLMNSRYNNSVALLSDLIDAQTMLFQAQVNYALGQSDSKVAYYKLLKSTGTIQ